MIHVHLVDSTVMQHPEANDWGVGPAGELYLQHVKLEGSHIARPRGQIPSGPTVKVSCTYAPGMWGVVERPKDNPSAPPPA